MEISLSTVRNVLRKALGFESFTARFIERIIATRMERFSIILNSLRSISKHHPTCSVSYSTKYSTLFSATLSIKQVISKTLPETSSSMQPSARYTKTIPHTAISSSGYIHVTELLACLDQKATFKTVLFTRSMKRSIADTDILHDTR